MRKALIVVGAATLLLSVAGAWYWQHTRAWLNAPIDSLTEPAVFEVRRGASLSSTLTELRERGLLHRPRDLSLWVRATRPNYALKAGEYQLLPGMSPIDVVDLLHSGKVLLHKLTIVEGATFDELRRQLESSDLVDVKTDALSGAALMRELGSADLHPEGQFFPDTYLVPRGVTDLQLLRRAHDRLRVELLRAWETRAPDLPLRNAYEALILASIVEKETALASERPQIAGVFVARLRKGMRLQTDPTVIYGIGDRYDGNIRKADLLRDTPYNTYTRSGLPPTPICLPSAAAIEAAVHPDVTGALYFVATGKGDGSHYFSRTLEEHNAALRRYLDTLRRKR